MKTYIFVRHGYADDDGHLLEPETARISILAKKLLRFGVRQDTSVMFTSPIRRVRQTASLLMVGCGLSNVVPCEALGRDINFLQPKDCLDVLLHAESVGQNADVGIFVGHASLRDLISCIVEQKKIVRPEMPPLDRAHALVFTEGVWHNVTPVE